MNILDITMLSFTRVIVKHFIVAHGNTHESDVCVYAYIPRRSNPLYNFIQRQPLILPSCVRTTVLHP